MLKASNYYRKLCKSKSFGLIQLYTLPKILLKKKIKKTYNRLTKFRGIYKWKKFTLLRTKARENKSVKFYRHFLLMKSILSLKCIMAKVNEKRIYMKR